MERFKGPKWVVGWREWVSLPEFDVERIKVKLDTGARSSALHTFDLESFRSRGRSMVRFVIHPLQRSLVEEIHAEAEVIDKRRVRSSSGHVETRPVIRSVVRVLDREWSIDLTLTNRDEMGFRMLLGREALRGLFLVDPSRSYLAGRPRRARPKSRSHS